MEEWNGLEIGTQTRNAQCFKQVSTMLVTCCFNTNNLSKSLGGGAGPPCPESGGAWANPRRARPPSLFLHLCDMTYNK